MGHVAKIKPTAFFPQDISCDAVAYGTVSAVSQFPHTKGSKSAVGCVIFFKQMASVVCY